MDFNFGKKKALPRETKNNCEIVIEKTAKGVKRRIKGECSPAQLRALGASGNLDSDIPEST